MRTPETAPIATRHRKGPAKIGALVPATVGPVFSKRGFASADLAVAWPDIVGAGIARHTRPLNLQWPRHGAENGIGATLIVACAPAFALDLQQMAPVLLERINQRLGWKAASRLMIKQMPIKASRTASPLPAVTEDDIAQASRITAEIRTDSLRAVMTRLGAASLARARRQITRD